MIGFLSHIYIFFFFKDLPAFRERLAGDRASDDAIPHDSGFYQSCALQILFPQHNVTIENKYLSKDERSPFSTFFYRIETTLYARKLSSAVDRIGKRRL